MNFVIFCNFLKFFFSDNDDGVVELELKDLGLVFSWPSQRLREMFSELGLSSKTCSPECLKVITSLVEELSFPESKIGLSSGVSAFLYLYTSIIGCVRVCLFVFSLIC